MCIEQASYNHVKNAYMYVCMYICVLRDNTFVVYIYVKYTSFVAWSLHNVTAHIHTHAHTHAANIFKYIKVV